MKETQMNIPNQIISPDAEILEQTKSFPVDLTHQDIMDIIDGLLTLQRLGRLNSQLVKKLLIAYQNSDLFDPNSETGKI